MMEGTQLSKKMQDGGELILIIQYQSNYIFLFRARPGLVMTVGRAGEVVWV